MHRRVNVTLPEETIQLIDRAVARGTGAGSSTGP